MNKWQKIQEFLDIKSGAVLGAFTIQMMLMCWVSFFTPHDIKAGILTVYATVISGVTVHGVTKLVNGDDK